MTEALGITAAIILARRVGALNARAPVSDARLAAALHLSRVLAHVEHDESRTVMRAAGWQRFPGGGRGESAGEPPRLSEVRFRRLMQTEPGEDLVTGLIRLVRLLDGWANVGALAHDFLHWGDAVRERWAYDYYAASIAAPSPESHEDIDA